MVIFPLLPFFFCFFWLITAGCSFLGSFVSALFLGMFFTWGGVCSYAFLVLAVFLMWMTPVVSHQVLQYSSLGSFFLCHVLGQLLGRFVFGLFLMFSCWSYGGIASFFFSLFLSFPVSFSQLKFFHCSIRWWMLFFGGSCRCILFWEVYPAWFAFA